jgi:C2 domain
VKQVEYEIMAEVGCGVCMPETKKYKIKISINDWSITTAAPLESKENYCRWNHRFDVQLLTCSYPHLKQMDRIYVYLMDGDVPVCYWQGKPTDFANPNPDYMWLPFTADLAVGKVKNQFNAGMFSLKLSIHDKAKSGGSIDFRQYPAWKKPPPKRLSSWKIRCFIYQCKDLPAADSNGSSDPYVEIWSSDKNK